MAKIFKKNKKTKKRKFKFEFTKIIVVVVFLICTRWIELTYKLAQSGKEQTAEQLSIAVVTVMLGAIVSYCLKSFGEKNSRNKYSILEEEREGEDENGY